MKLIRSHFAFSKNQQNGILLLVSIIIALQCVYMFAITPDDIETFDKNAFKEFQDEIDSLKKLALKERQPKIYPFNPNFITDYKGYTLGMTNVEIDRLLKYREQNRWVNSKKEFQKVTKISDSLLQKIGPFFKFPDWVKNSNSNKFNTAYSKNYKPKTRFEKLDLNTATAKQLQRVNGIGEKLSERIIRYRNKFKGGFIADIQLQDVYGLSPEVIERITAHFTVKTPRSINKININTATRDDLVTIQHIDYELAAKIIEQRTLRDGYKDFSELLKIQDFPIDKIEIIKLYLTFN